MIPVTADRISDYFLKIDGEPVPKARPRITRRGTYTPAKTRNYESTIRLAFIIKYPEAEIWPGRVKISIDAYIGIPKSANKRTKVKMALGEISPLTKPDLDNLIKTVLDALKGLAYKDDTQVCSIMANKHYEGIEKGSHLRIWVGLR